MQTDSSSKSVADPDLSLYTDVGLRLGQVHRVWRSVVDMTVKPLGLTQSRWTALITLRRLGEGSTQKQLAEALGIELSSLSRTLDQLERQGLIIRRTCGEDRRARNVSFTPEGCELLAQVDSLAEEARTMLLAGLPQKDLDALLRALAHIEENAGQLLSSC